ncbi:MAG: DUF2752 domain-containing protein [Clostridiales bacterium]|nr:DUF2752 domain-containing protein [Clostridiales bacterium]
MKKEIKNDVRNLLVGSFAFIIFTQIMNYLFGTICTLKLFFGIPCPFCGITRAAIELLNLNIKKSFEMHPLLIFVIIAMIFYLFNKYFCEKYVKIYKIYVIILLFLFITIYVLRMINDFPNVEPLVYFDNNIFHIIKK